MKGEDWVPLVACERICIEMKQEQKISNSLYHIHVFFLSIFLISAKNIITERTFCGRCR